VALGQLPTYQPVQGVPPPDLPGTPDGLVSPAYLTYPKDKLFQSVKDPPGRGGEISVSLRVASGQQGPEREDQRHDPAVWRLQREVGHAPGGQ
jgi:hypothetical protein